jgi:dihydroorotase (multifunctional complex type)
MRTRFVNLRVSTTGNDTTPAEIVVNDGVIEEILVPDAQTAVEAEHWEDLGGALVLPGVVDPDVDFGDPGYPLREDFFSGTAAAAAGGVTCVADVGQDEHTTVTDAESLQMKIRTIANRALVDYMVWASPTEPDATSVVRLSEVAEAGVAGFYVDLEHDESAAAAANWAQLTESLHEAWRLGVPVLVQAINSDLVGRLTQNIRTHQTDPDRAEAWSESHPPESEIEAVAAVRELARSTGARVHFVGVSSRKAHQLVVEGREQGIPLTSGVRPTALAFVRDDLPTQGSRLKLSPALQSEADRVALWNGLADATIETVSSGHRAIQIPEEKSSGSVWTDRSGAPGVELTLPYLYSEGVCTGHITLDRLIELLSTSPARLLGIGHLKGKLQPGMHADFVVFADDESWIVTSEVLHGRSRISPFEGQQLTGRVRATYLRGRRIYHREADGTEMFAPPGHGRWLIRGRG